jgi:hypothetical protein
MMRKSFAYLGTTIFVLASTLASAQTPPTKTQDVIVVGPDTKLGADAGNQPTVVAAQVQDLRADWTAWLHDAGLKEGQNDPKTPGQPPFQIFMAMTEVTLSPSDSHWLDERALATDQAMLAAKGKFANFIASDVKAGRTSSLFHSAGDGIPDASAKVARTLSVMDKMRTLTGKELDDQIKKFDPSWDGTGKTAAQQTERSVLLRRQYEEQVSNYAAAFTTGAAPIYTAEGPTRNGYGVLVGIVISSNMQKIARAFSDPNIKLSAAAPEAPVTNQIADRYKADPAFLAATEGVRVMTDEHGERVLVCFAGVAETGDNMTTEKEAENSCRKRIAQFVAEQIVVKDGGKGGFAYDKLAPNGSGQDGRVSFSKTMTSSIEAVTPLISMSGLTQIGYYEINHHYSHQPMAVAVYEWSQASNAAAREIRKESEQAGKPTEPIQAGPSGAAPGGVPAAASVNRGMSSNPSTF